jgi:DUF971 family protein
MSESDPNPSGTPSPPVPTEIVLRQKSRVVEFAYEDGKRYELSYEFLRVLTPSAEARGHGPGEDTLQAGKRDVDIIDLEPVGHYAIKPTFSDGHDSGIYSWDILHTLCTRKDELWQAYLQKLDQAGESRDPDRYPLQTAKSPLSCGIRR